MGRDRASNKRIIRKLGNLRSEGSRDKAGTSRLPIEVIERTRREDWGPNGRANGGAMGQAVGQSAERQAIQMLRYIKKSGICPWFRGVRAATEEEDARGIDVVLVSVDNKPHRNRVLSVQVKASERLAERHRESHPEIPVVVIDYIADHKTIERQLRRFLADMRIAGRL